MHWIPMRSHGRTAAAPFFRTHLVPALLVTLLALVAAAPACAQAPVFEGVVTDRTNNPSFSGGADLSLSVGVPPGAAGDLLIFLVGVKINPATTTPAGWTPIVAGFNDAICDSEAGIGIRCQLSAWWKISDGTESSVSVTFGPNPRQAAGAVLRYSGTDAVTPIGTHATQKGTSDTVVGPAVTTTEADNRVLFVALADGDEAKSLFTSEPTTSRFNVASTSPFGPGSSFSLDAVVLAASDRAFAAAGSTGTESWSLPSAEEYRTLTIPIRPPVTPANQAPEAVCQDVTATADAACQADADVDGGSSDPDGDPITVVQDPAGPYGLGDTLVTLTVTDDEGESDSCTATVTVVDEAAPVIDCNAPPTITPPDAPVSFTATASDNCGVAGVQVTAYECFKFTKKGKRIDKGESCVVSTDGATVTIDDSGGVGTTIRWTVTATDSSGNAITQHCSLEVANPGKGH